MPKNSNDLKNGEICTAWVDLMSIVKFIIKVYLDLTAYFLILISDHLSHCTSL